MASKVVQLTKIGLGDSRTAPSVDIDRVLEISAGRFAEQGFDGVSMREISRECGCPVPSIYYHFTSKNELYREAYSNKIEHSIDAVNARLKHVKEPLKRFEALIEAFHQLFTNDRTLFLLTKRDVIYAAVSGRPLLSRHQFNYFNQLIRSVASEAVGSPISNETAYMIGSLVFGLCGLSMVVHDPHDQNRDAALQTERAGLVRAAKAILSL